MTMANSLRPAERQRPGTPVRPRWSPRVPPQSSFKAAGRQPKSDEIEALAPSLQELVEFQREFHERTIPLWNAMQVPCAPGTRHYRFVICLTHSRQIGRSTLAREARTRAFTRSIWVPAGESHTLAHRTVEGISMMTATIERDETGLRVPDKTTLMSLGATKWPRDPGGRAERRATMDASSVLAVCHGENHLLAAIPPWELARWKSRLESVDMPLGAVLHGAGRTPTHVYFPTSAIFSLVYVTEQGASAEVALIGNEGLVGIGHFLGGQSMPNRAVVQCAGRGFRVSAQTIKDELDRSGPMLRLLLRYAQALMTQIAQTAVCYRHHSPDQQLSCLLLRSLDRVQGGALVLTQELVAHMLGLRRETVTAAALRLREAGLIQYARGHISVLNRTGLERSTCECYSVVKTEYDRLLADRLAA